MATKSKTSAKKTTNSKSASIPASSKSSSVKSEKTKHNKTALGVFGAIILLFVFLFLFKSLFVAATVNGEPIGRFAVIQAVEKQDGKQALDNLVTKALILQEAKKRNVTVSQSDINTEIQKISKSLSSQGSSLDQALAAQGMTKTQLNDAIRLQLLLQKMVGNNVNVTQKDVDDFIAQNKSMFPEGTTDAQMKTQATAQLKQQKAQAATQNFLKSLQSNSKIIYFVHY
jgi:parvulin-like peptidyl-prolyl isomerase